MQKNYTFITKWEIWQPSMFRLFSSSEAIFYKPLRMLTTTVNEDWLYFCTREYNRCFVDTSSLAKIVRPFQTNFTNILGAAFLYESVMRSMSVLTVFVPILFLQVEFGTKATSKMLVKMNYISTNDYQYSMSSFCTKNFPSFYGAIL